ncbi:hypothetical protein [Rhizobium leguminosarum]|uniref:hypothetical protein n=1 Tax=Rhizobium leguminosarum TaxID=384 RepID=UPI001FF076A1|nr:hypothetical protein [Rhizobium leguminosarum]
MNKDIGFTKVGQDAVVKLEAFPFTRYGTTAADVTELRQMRSSNPTRRAGGDPAARHPETTFGGAETMRTSCFPDNTEPVT